MKLISYFLLTVLGMAMACMVGCSQSAPSYSQTVDADAKHPSAVDVQSDESSQSGIELLQSDNAGEKAADSAADTLNGVGSPTGAEVDAEDVLAKGLLASDQEGKKAFVVVGAPWCGWCGHLKTYLEENAALFDEDFVIVKIDEDEMKNGKAVSERLASGRPGGLPWFAIMDGQGKELACSVGERGNVGFPVTPSEVTHFVNMVRQTTEQSDDQLLEVEKSLFAMGRQVKGGSVGAAGLASGKSDEQAAAAADDDSPPPCPDLAVDPAWKKLAPDGKVWLDVRNQTVVVAGQVCHREGPLEFFACPPNTKEYESVIVVDSKSFLVHTALLAIGLTPGHPVKYSPEYEAAVGPVLNIVIEWDQDGERQSIAAQEWVKNMNTGESMPHEWVFAGSGFWDDEETGESHYNAEGGELICLSNFSTATIDLPIESSQRNDSLLFGAFEERIPPLGTKVYIKLSEKKAVSP